MTSLRTKSFKTALKVTKRLRSSVSEENLLKKRRDLQRLEKYFPLRKGTKLEVVKKDGFKGEWVSQPKSAKDKVFLYLHGGGFVFYPRLYLDLVSRLTEAARVRAFALDYSLAPEHKYPKALEESVAAYRWLLKSHGPDNIAIMGDSAGGSLVLSLLHMLRKQKMPNPACAVVISPATDATLSGVSMIGNKTKDFFISAKSLDFFMRAYFGDAPKNDPIASPLFGPLKGFPPLLVHIDKDEIMYEDSARLIKKARAAGVKVDTYETTGLWHVYHLYARFVPDSKKAIRNIADYLQAHFGMMKP